MCQKLGWVSANKQSLYLYWGLWREKHCIRLYKRGGAKVGLQL